MRVAVYCLVNAMPMKPWVLLLALCPFAALAQTPQQPSCNLSDFFTSQFDYTVGSVVEPGQVVLLGERAGCLDEERAGCRTGEKVAPASSLVIGDRWNEYYCVQVLPPGKEVVGWAPAGRVMKTGHMAETDFTSWLGYWDGRGGRGGRTLEIRYEGRTLLLSMLPPGGEGAGTLIGSAEPMGDELFLGEAPCEARASLQGSQLVVTDNGQCATPADSLRGVYGSRTVAERLERLMKRLEDR
jgi:hypothetical protein